MNRNCVSGFLLMFLGWGCIAKRPVEKSLVRAAVDRDTLPTCASILPDLEYKSLISQLKPYDPLTVVSTNDLHGRIDEQTLELKVSEKEKRSIRVGGLERLASYLAALCRSSKGRLLYVDAGDSYQGSALSNTTHGQAVVDAFSALGLMASTFGNHEFDFGQEQIKTWLSGSNRLFWYVTSSVQSKVGGKSTPWAELGAPRFARSVLFDVAGIRVGIAGYTTESTALKSLPDNVANITFGELSQVLGEEAGPLKQQGAQVTLLLSHAGGKCNMSMAAPAGDEACVEAHPDELTAALKALPTQARKWNLIVAGHSHSAQRHLIAGAAVVQSTGLGQSLTHAQLTVNQSGVNVQLFDPIYLCETHFENWAGCHPDEWAWKASRPQTLGRIVPARVVGQPVHKSDGNKVLSVLSPHRDRLKEQMAKNIAQFPAELKHDRTAKSPAAACLVDAWVNDLRSANEVWGGVHSSKIDAAFLNSGALREGVAAGNLTWGRLFEIIPYDNTAHIVVLTLEELLRFARSHEDSPHDYLLASDGWVVRRAANSSPAPRTTAVTPTVPLNSSPNRFVVAISSFSKTFLSRAGISATTFDTGQSVRASIARILGQGIGGIPSCRQAVETRMEF